MTRSANARRQIVQELGIGGQLPFQGLCVFRSAPRNERYLSTAPPAPSPTVPVGTALTGRPPDGSVREAISSYGSCLGSYGP